MMGTVYFIQGIDGGPIKIGYTARDVSRRVAAIQPMSPVRLIVLSTVAGSRGLEERLHAHLAAHRLWGEWFEDCPEVRAAIAAPESVELPSPDESTVGARIRNRRQAKGWTQDELASAIGVGATQVTRWELSWHEPRVDRLFAIAKALGCDPNYLFEGRLSEPFVDAKVAKAVKA